MKEPQGPGTTILMVVKAAPHAVKISFLLYHPKDHSQEVCIYATSNPENISSRSADLVNFYLSSFYSSYKLPR